MRILFSSMPATGHFGPMVPFVRASVRGGHRATVAGTPPLARAAEETGALFWPVDEPDAGQLASAVDGVRGLSRGPPSKGAATGWRTSRMAAARAWIVPFSAYFPDVHMRRVDLSLI